MVPAKYSPKVKLEPLTTLECQSWVELCVPVFWGSLGFYSSVESNSYACATSLFHIGKIFINVRILPNPPRIRILFILGFYGLGLITRHKSSPLRISWGPHNDQFNATWPIGPSTPLRLHSICSLSTHISWSIKPIQMDPSPLNFFFFSCPFTPWIRDHWVEGLVEWRFNQAFWGTPPTLTGWLMNINEEGHVSLAEWSLSWIEAPLRLPFHSFYINQPLLLPFFYFLLKSIIKAHPSLLLDYTVQLLHPVSTPFYRPASTR